MDGAIRRMRFSKENFMQRLGVEGLQAIEHARLMASTNKRLAIIRLFAVAMHFYRQPVGDLAFDALHSILGVEETAALSFLTGYSLGSSGREDAWEELAFPTRVTEGS
jgi:hypothetical protein